MKDEPQRKAQEEKAKAKPTLKKADVQQRLKELEQEIKTSPLTVRQADLVEHVPSVVSSAGTTGSTKVTTTDAAAQTTGFNLMAFWALAFLSLFLAQVPGIQLLFTPITQFTTLIHELSHALVCQLTGGHVTALTFVSDGQGHGGITQFVGGMPFFTTQAGYLGTALFGCFLIYIGQFAKYSKYVLAGLGVAIGLVSVFLIGANVGTSGIAGVLSFLWGAALCASLLWLSKKLSPVMANLVVLFLAIQTALNSLSSIVVLIQWFLGFQQGPWSDATIMQNMTHIPAILWSLFWLLSSLAMVGFTLWHTYGKRLLPGKVRTMISMK